MSPSRGLACDLQKGERDRIRLEFQGPPNPERDIVHLDMVNEGLCGFAKEGSETTDVLVDVKGPDD